MCATGAAAADVPPTIHGLLLARVDRLPEGRGTPSRKRPSSGPVFGAALLQALASEPGGARWRAGAPSARRTSWRRSCGPGGDGVASVPGRASPLSIHERCSSRRSRIRASCSAAGPSCTLGPAMRWRAWSVGAPRVSRISRPSRVTGAWAVTGARRPDYLVTAGDWARGLYANEDAIQHYERALDDARGVRGSPRRGAGWSASVWATCSCRSAVAPRRSVTTRRSWRPRRRPRIARHRPGSAQARGHGMGRGRPAGGRCPAPRRARAHGGSGGAHRAGAPLSRDGTAGVPERRQRRRGRVGGARPVTGRAPGGGAGPVRTPRRGRRSGRRGGSAMAQAYNTLGVALARMGRFQEAVGHIERSLAVAEAHDLMQAACRGYTNLGRALQHARPQARHRHLRPGTGDGQEDRRPRTPVAAEHEPGRRLLRAHEPVRGAGPGGGAGPPSTWIASSASSTIWRCR